MLRVCRPVSQVCLRVAGVSGSAWVRLGASRVVSRVCCWVSRVCLGVSWVCLGVLRVPRWCNCVNCACTSGCVWVCRGCIAVVYVVVPRGRA